MRDQADEALLCCSSLPQSADRECVRREALTSLAKFMQIDIGPTNAQSRSPT